MDCCALINVVRYLASKSIKTGSVIGNSGLEFSSEWILNLMAEHNFYTFDNQI